MRRKKTKPVSLPSNLSNQNGDPEAEVIGRETGDRIDHYLDQQKPAYRQMAYLRFYEGMPLRQIATVVGVPLGSVKSRLHLIKQELKSILENENEI
jgi:RNA polymerase sigma-70 factor (ECF subfamily)